MTSRTALDLWRAQITNSSVHRITLGCPKIDAALGGGIISSGITEIVGEAGSGKTQFALVLSLRVQLSTEQGECVYLSCGEGPFPIKRLQQIAEEIAKMENKNTEVMFSKVHIEQVYNIDDIQTIVVSGRCTIYISLIKYIM